MNNTELIKQQEMLYQQMLDSGNLQGAQVALDRLREYNQVEEKTVQAESRNQLNG